MEWKVLYQSTPYNFTDPHVLVIEADSREHALVVAYYQLTRQGHAINPDTVAYDLQRELIDWEAAKAIGWPKGPMLGDVHIRSLTPLAAPKPPEAAS